MKEWKTYRIGDICKTNSSQYSPKEAWDEFLYLDTGNITRNIIEDIVRYSSAAELPSRARRKVVNDDIIFSTVRPNQCHFGILSNPPANLLVSTGFTVITANTKIVDPYYLYYYLTQDSIVDYLHSIGEQAVSAYPSIKAQDIEDIEIELPDLSTQNNIAKTLRALDNKIQLNRQINDNLEQQAQALYKSWFVDFEPFKDGEFMDSELGLIPKGWQVGTYEQIIQTTISGDWGKDIMTGNYTHKVACVRGCDFQDMSIGVRGKTPERYILEKNYQAKRLIDNDVIVEISGGTSTISTGRVCLINADLLGKYNNDIVCTNFCKVVRPIQSYGAYLYYSWKYKYDCRVMFGYENGTSGIKNFQISDFLSKEPVIIPSESSIKEFQTIIDTLQNNIQTNGSEIMKLESLRDTLLPRLMSGELEINEIDC